MNVFIVLIINFRYKIDSMDQPSPLKISITYNKDDPLCLKNGKSQLKDLKIQVFLKIIISRLFT